MNSVEINGSFYSLQRPSSFASWAEQTPEDFVFAVKGGRFITHMKKLNEIETPLANFFASGVLALGRRLGPILWQLPPNLGFDADRMDRSSPCCRGRTGQAAKLALGHDARIPEDRALTKASIPGSGSGTAWSRGTSRSGIRPARRTAKARGGDGLGRQSGHLADVRSGHRRLPVRPAARRHRAVRQRVHRRGADIGGRSGSAAGWRRVRTCTSTATTTRRYGRRTTRSGCWSGCAEFARQVTAGGRQVLESGWPGEADP